MPTYVDPQQGYILHSPYDVFISGNQVREWDHGFAHNQQMQTAWCNTDPTDAQSTAFNLYYSRYVSISGNNNLQALNGLRVHSYNREQDTNTPALRIGDTRAFCNDFSGVWTRTYLRQEWYNTGNTMRLFANDIGRNAYNTHVYSWLYGYTNPLTVTIYGNRYYVNTSMENLMQWYGYGAISFTDQNGTIYYPGNYVDLTYGFLFDDQTYNLK